MDILKHTKVSGSIFCEYAYFMHELCYFNKNDEMVARYYDIVLPEGAMISDLKVVDNSGTALNGKIALTEEAKKAHIVNINGASIKLVRTSATTYRLLASGVFRGDITTILLSYYIILRTSKFATWFNLPFAETFTDVTLTFENPENILMIESPTHLLNIKKMEKYWTAELTALPKTIDLALKIEYNIPHINTVYATNSMFGENLAFYKLFPKFAKRDSELKDLLFILDATRTIPGNVFIAARDALLAMLRNLPEGQNFQIMLCSPELSFFFDEYQLPTDDVLRNVIDILIDLKNFKNKGSLNLVGTEFRFINENITPIIVTHGVCKAKARVLEYAYLTLKDTGASVVSLGNHCDNVFWTEFSKITKGSMHHIYSTEDFTSTCKNAIQKINGHRFDNLEIMSIGMGLFGGEIIQDVRSSIYKGESLDIIVKSSGGMPSKFLLKGENGFSEIICVEQSYLFENFNLISLMYAERKMRELMVLLQEASPGSWRRLKKIMGDISLKYGLISSETSFVVEVKTGLASTVYPLEYHEIPNRESSKFDFSENTSIFRDFGGFRPEDKNLEKKFEKCTEILLNCYRKDGSFSNPHESCPQNIVNQTAYALMALSRIDDLKKYKSPYTDGVSFLLKNIKNEVILNSEILWGLKDALNTGLLNLKMEEEILDILKTRDMSFEDVCLEPLDPITNTEIINISRYVLVHKV
ncbi:MAG: hypothetical protein RR957_03020 [Oscillospiraceae bacterium]